MTLAKELEGDIAYRIRLYSKCIAKTTENYKNWLKEEYSRKLQSALRNAFVTSDEEN
jgi:tRNA uridine 5-carbamoylmethylation protein Kti12